MYEWYLDFETCIEITIVGGRAPFNMAKKDPESSSRYDDHVNGFSLHLSVTGILIVTHGLLT